MAPRREFRLPELDEEYLDGRGKQWETVVTGNAHWLFIHDWTVPVGYNHGSVRIALNIPMNYSDSQIDMVYFSPSLARTDGKAINALTTITVCGEVFQQWSRHRTGANPWRPGEDDIASHLGLVDHWLAREFQK